MKRNVAFNAGALYLIQGIDYACALAVFPYLTRVLGAGGFGTLSLAQNVVGYLLVVVNYGFHLTAVNLVVQSRDCLQQRSRVFWSVIAAKALLLGLAAPFFALIVYRSPGLRNIDSVIAACCLVVLANLILPTWYFQGTARVAVAAAVSVGARIFFLPWFFVLVASPYDVVWAAVLQNVALFVAAGSLIGILLARREVVWLPPSLAHIKGVLADGRHVFYGACMRTFLSNLNIVAVAAFGGPVAAGIFSGADRLRLVIQVGFDALVQAVHPHLVKDVLVRERVISRTVIRLLWLLGCSGACVAAGAWMFADPVVPFVLGEEYRKSADVLEVLCLIPAIVAIGVVLGAQTLLVIGGQRLYAVSIFFAGALNAVLLYVLVPRFGPIGAAWSLVVAESVQLALFCVALYVRLRSRRR